MLILANALRVENNTCHVQFKRVNDSVPSPLLSSSPAATLEVAR